jgi:hypothetical protein
VVKILLQMHPKIFCLLLRLILDNKLFTRILDGF